MLGVWELDGRPGQRGCGAASIGAAHGAEVQSTAQPDRSHAGARQQVLKSPSGKTAVGSGTLADTKLGTLCWSL